MKRELKAILGFAYAFIMLAWMQAQAAIKDETFHNNVETHIGELAFDHGVPTEVTLGDTIQFLFPK